MTRVFAIAGTTLAALSAAAYLYVSRGDLGIPSLFVVLAAATLGLLVYLVGRSAQALVEPRPDAEVRIATGRRRKELEREKQALVKALKELEFDHKMRKISDEDYAEIAARYRARALDVMRRLDDAGDAWRKLVEEDVARRRKETKGAA